MNAEALPNPVDVSYGSLVAASPMPILSFDSWGHVTSWNPAAEQLFGWTAAEVIGSRHSALFDGNDDIDPLLAAALRGEAVVGVEMTRQARSGDDIYLSVSMAPVRDGAGQVVGAMALVMDIAEQKRIDLEKDAFLVAVTHDLKSPLMVMRGLTQLLLRRARAGDSIPPAQLEADLRQIESTISRVTGSLNSLLDVTRMQMGRPLELECRPIDLVALTRRVASEQQARAKEHRISVQAAVPSLVGVWDSFRLERVIANLISNATKYSPPGPVHVRVAQERERAVLAVRDEGVGIPAADLPRIFDRFFRGRNVVGLIPGSGVGLAGVRQIVEHHGGTIEVASREGEGTTFVVRLPLDRTPKG